MGVDRVLDPCVPGIGVKEAPFLKAVTGDIAGTEMDVGSETGCRLWSKQAGETRGELHKASDTERFIALRYATVRYQKALCGAS